jgi:hypothetical protein
MPTRPDRESDVDEDRFVVCRTAAFGWEWVTVGASVWLATKLQAGQVATSSSLGGRFVVSMGSVDWAASSSPAPLLRRGEITGTVWTRERKPTRRAP